MKSFFNFFSSVKLAIVLLIIITVASILGTLIPQLRSPAEYAAMYGKLSDLLIRLEVTKLYQSWWFVSLLFLFSVNILICTLTRFSPKLKKVFKPTLEGQAKSLRTLKINDCFKKHENIKSTIAELKNELSSRHYRFREKSEENRLFLLARKKTSGLFGSDVVHLGLLIILAGGIISGLGGFRTNLNISEGETLPVPNSDFELRLDKFETEYYSSGAVKDWKSHLTVIEDTKPVLSKTIEVNHPLSHKGFVFYQSYVGWDWKNPSLEIIVKKRKDPSFLSSLKLRMGEKVTLAEENIEISLLDFVPDFIIGEGNEITTRSLDPNNPAALIEGWQEGEKIFSGWIFQMFPDFARIHSEKETDYVLEFKDLEAAQYSGIQLAKDPGVNLIWAGCILLMLGLSLAFYWPTREIRVILEESQGKTEVVAGGIASKNRDTFQAEFEKIMLSLRRPK